MDPEKDVEKMADMEEHVPAFGSPTLYTEHERQEDEEKHMQGADGEPDIEHEEVEEMDAGHQADLRRQRVCYTKERLLDLKLTTSSQPHRSRLDHKRLPIAMIYGESPQPVVQRVRRASCRD